MFSRLVATATPKMARSMSTTKAPVKVAVTGAAGAIGYAMLFRIASGEMLGKDQPVILQCLEMPGKALDAMKGVEMELRDCAFPLLHDVVSTDSQERAFEDASYTLLVGAKPRGPGMERADLLKDNGKIFTGQGKALNATARKDCKVLVVGNPANTNCLILANAAKDMDPKNFTAMMRLDHNRAMAQLASKTNSTVNDIEKLTVWGNHSPTMYPDIRHTTIKGQDARTLINDEAWITDNFMPTVQQRGAAIIKARGASSAASAGGAAIDHMRDWALGSDGKWVTMGIPSENDEYGIGEGVYFGYACTCENGEYKKVEGISVDAFGEEYIAKTKKELFDEREAVRDLL